MTFTSITKAFHSLKGPRKIQTPPHSLLNIITISICGLICGADNFVTITMIRGVKTDNDRHNFAHRHMAIALTFFRTIFKQLLVPLRDKDFAKVIDIAKQFN